MFSKCIFQVLRRLELGDIKIEKINVNLDDIVDTVFATVRDKARNKGLYLKKEVSPDIQEIKADRNRLIQIFLNLKVRIIIPRLQY